MIWVRFLNFTKDCSKMYNNNNNNHNNNYKEAEEIINCRQPNRLQMLHKHTLGYITNAERRQNNPVNQDHSRYCEWERQRNERKRKYRDSQDVKRSNSRIKNVFAPTHDGNQGSMFTQLKSNLISNSWPTTGQQSHLVSQYIWFEWWLHHWSSFPSLRNSCWIFNVCLVRSDIYRTFNFKFYAGTRGRCLFGS